MYVTSICYSQDGNASADYSVTLLLRSVYSTGFGFIIASGFRSSGIIDPSVVYFLMSNLSNSG
jgi:hypothetical protein